MIASNQPIGIKKKNVTKKYTFSKQEFKQELVPEYAYDLKEENGLISFQCAFDSFGSPIYKNESKKNL